MHFKICCCIFLSIAISMVFSKSIAAKNKKIKTAAAKDAQHPNKRISTQQKIGSGHSKGPMANNVQNSVPLPVVMPFPMIPFDDRYPILFPPNGKSKKGKGKKKDPKDETEDETDKDVDDEKDGGGENKQYKDHGKIKDKPDISKVPKENAKPVAKPGTEEVLEDDSEKDEDEDEDKDIDSKKYKNSNKEVKEESSKKEESATEEEEKAGDYMNTNAEANEEEEESVNSENSNAEVNEEEQNSEGSKNSNTEEDKEEEEHKSLSKEEDVSKHETKKAKYRHNSKTKPKRKEKARHRRSVFEPIIGNPEDIMPYLMFDSEADPTKDIDNGHVINTRSVQEEEGPEVNNQYSLVEEADLPHVIYTRNADENEFNMPREMDIRDVKDESEVPHVINTRDVDEDEEPEVPHVIYTREVNEEDEPDSREEQEEEDAPRDIRTRSVPDEVPDLGTAEKKFKDAQVAAEALTQIEKALGANPENAVEESHSLSDYLRKETEQYDEEIARDIMQTQKAQTRNKIVVNDDGTKRDTDFVTAKRKLDNDRAKERELQQELKELKDIEFMTTELELAKYLAMENARHQLQYARAVSRTQVNQPKPQAEQTPGYSPQITGYSQMASQQPIVTNTQPYIQQAPSQPIASAWQSVYPPAITYAYSPMHEAQASFDSTSHGRGDSSRIFSEHQVHSYFSAENPSPARVPAQTNPVRLQQPSYFNAPKYQSAVERPRPGQAVHTDAQSRHIKKPAPYKAKVYQPRPYQQRFSKQRTAQETAAYAGRRPTVSFPGPTYSSPPFSTRNSRPKLKTNRYKSLPDNRYNTGYKTQSYGAAPSPALLSFFTDQHQMPPVNNFYQISPLSAQQHYPMYTSSYRAPVSYENQFGQQNHHYVEQTSEHYNVHNYFPAAQNRPQKQVAPVRTQQKQDQRLTSATASSHPEQPNQQTAPSKQKQATAYAGSQRVSPHYTTIVQHESQFKTAPAVTVQPLVPVHTVASTKQGIPFYQSYYQPQYQAPYSEPVVQRMPQTFYPQQSSRPFETMDTDSTVFHGQGRPPVISQPQQQTTNMANPDEVPLGYGLFPLPDGADEKMDSEDKEVKDVYDHIKDDKVKLQETKQAADAVTKIENKVGFDPGSIAKLIDFVKQAAVKDVDLSDKAVKRDQVTIKRMDVAHATDNSQSKPDTDNVVTKEAYEKLKVDQELLKESKERLDKIKRMELIVTGIEVAKYSAMLRKGEKLNTDVEQMNRIKAAKKTKIGDKRGLKATGLDNGVNHRVVQPLANGDFGNP